VLVLIPTVDVLTFITLFTVSILRILLPPLVWTLKLLVFYVTLVWIISTLDDVSDSLVVPPILKSILVI
jgi:hypothetical protein